MAETAAVVRLVRAALGITQEELAHRLKVTVSTANKWEREHHLPQKTFRHTMRRWIEADIERITAQGFKFSWPVGW